MVPDDIATGTRKLALACRTIAKAHDEEFLKHADPRAVQGGAVCELAEQWRSKSRELHKMASELRAMAQ